MSKMDPLLKKEVDRLDNIKFWLQNIKNFPMFADKEQEKLERAFELVESVASNYDSGSNLIRKSSWNKNPRRGKHKA
jgi:predicted house-cleaning noncanonical NTP pyrophosphatase (MazG superfamily)